jgi:hypothetical protein
LIGIATFPNIFPMAPLFPNRRIALRRIAVSPYRRLAISPSHVFQFPALLAMSALTALAS